MNTKLLALNATLGLVSGLAASSTIWLVLTRPADAATVLASGNYGQLALTVLHQVGTWGHVVLRFL